MSNSLDTGQARHFVVPELHGSKLLAKIISRELNQQIKPKILADWQPVRLTDVIRLLNRAN